MTEERPTFKPGDIVVLKSGGPQMTVDDVDYAVVCKWFSGKKLERGEFSAEALRLFEKDSDDG